MNFCQQALYLYSSKNIYTERMNLCQQALYLYSSKNIYTGRMNLCQQALYLYSSKNIYTERMNLCQQALYLYSSKNIYMERMNLCQQALKKKREELHKHELEVENVGVLDDMDIAQKTQYVQTMIQLNWACGIVSPSIFALTSEWLR